MSNHFTSLKPLALLLGLLFFPVVTDAQEAGQDTVVVVPETGILPVKPSRNFTGPEDVIACSFFASNTSGLSFSQFRLDTVIVASATKNSTGVFLIAKPGSYKLTFTDEESTAKINSTVISWQDTPGQAYKKSRRLYKFVNEAGHVGFVRDEKYASDSYQYCDLAEGENVFIPLAEKNVEAIADLLKTTPTALQFIPFEGPWKNVPTLDTEPASVNMPAVEPEGQSAVYGLDGIRTAKPRKGINVVDGRKVIVR